MAKPMNPIFKALGGLVILGAVGSAVYLATDRQDPDSLRGAIGDDDPGSTWIYDDWEQARARAKKEEKPIFAVFRCVP